MLSGINKTVSEWSSLPVKGTEKKPYLKKVTLPESGKKSLPESGNAYYPNQVNTKDKHTKDNKDNINNPPKSPRAVSFDAASVQLPDWLSVVTWSSWVEYRRDLKKPIKSQHTVTQAINLLDRCRLNGYAPEEIINRSIANGWQGLFEPDGQAKRSRDSGKESLHWNSPDAWEDFL